ncbi:MAG TPA: hypothetical protein VEJ20_08910 [Candidatus Eremiobacteraceae bacterium]|nr:hypothetical protein [Candidatus Eremiobacteraceae bacterium]
MVRTIVVIALATFVIGFTLPNAWIDNGAQLPFAVDGHFDVTAVSPGPFADRLGLRVGDHINPRSLSFLERFELGEYTVFAPMTLEVERDGRTRDLKVPMPGWTFGLDGLAFVKRTTATIFVIVAAILLLLRPSTMLWGFFFYAVGSVNGGSFLAGWIDPLFGAIITTILNVMYSTLGPLGLLLFAARFPVASSGGWRRLVQRATPALMLIVVALTIVNNLYLAGIAISPAAGAFTTVLGVIVPTIAISALIAGLLQLEPSQQQRLRWVIAGFAVYYAAAIYQQLSGYLPAQGWPPAWTNAGWSFDVLNGLVIVIPLTVSYAVLRHHVLDINFVIGRGLVYGLVTSIAIAVFAIADWFLHRVLAQTNLALTGEIVAAVAIGFWLNGLHDQVDRFVDAVIFRRRHLAQQRLEQVAAGLPHTEAFGTIAAMVCDEPVDALGLRSAAFFRAHADARFHCEHEVSLPRATSATIDLDGELAVYLHGARGPVALHRLGWRLEGLEAGPATPVFAFPIFVRHELAAIAFFGGHESGEAIDPDEMRSLSGLCTGAAAALDHAAAAEIARKMEEYRTRIDALTRDVQMLRGVAPAAGS